jgi:hypothetical protein
MTNPGIIGSVVTGTTAGAGGVTTPGGFGLSLAFRSADPVETAPRTSGPMEDAAAMRDQDGLDIAFWMGLGLGLLIAWRRHPECRRLPSPAAADIEQLEAMWAAAPCDRGRDELAPGGPTELLECAGCGGLLEARAWRFCGWCGSALGWPTRS